MYCGIPVIAVKKNLRGAFVLCGRMRARVFCSRCVEDYFSVASTRTPYALWQFLGYDFRISNSFFRLIFPVMIIPKALFSRPTAWLTVSSRAATIIPKFWLSVPCREANAANRSIFNWFVETL